MKMPMVSVMISVITSMCWWLHRIEYTSWCLWLLYAWKGLCIMCDILSATKYHLLPSFLYQRMEHCESRNSVLFITLSHLSLLCNSCRLRDSLVNIISVWQCRSLLLPLFREKEEQKVLTRSSSWENILEHFSYIPFNAMSRTLYEYLLHVLLPFLIELYRSLENSQVNKSRSSWQLSTF